MDYPVLSWIEDYLRDRFGTDLSLLPSMTDQVILRLKNSSGRIVFCTCSGNGLPDPFNPAMAHWDARQGGWKVAIEADLPMPGWEDQSVLERKLPIEETEDGYVVNYPILNVIFWALTRQEERNSRIDLDVHQRFPGSKSHAAQNGYLDRPFIDEWLFVIGQVIQRCWPDFRLAEHSFRLDLSHDVDRPSRYGEVSFVKACGRMAADFLHRRFGFSSLMAPWINLSSRQALSVWDPYNVFSWIMDLSEELGVKSEFLFIAGRTSPRFDADYEIESPKIRRLLREIHVRGHRIGLHPSYNTFQRPDLIKAEFDRLKTVCDQLKIQQKNWASRMHYLRIDTGLTFRACNDAGIDYDCTLGYADLPGFRSGTCFEYRGFDTDAGKAMKIKIRPLVLMEQTILSKSYLGLQSNADGLSLMQRLKNRCRAVRGVFSLLWHNSELATEDKKRMYRNILLS
jgi:hypothetical protein